MTIWAVSTEELIIIDPENTSPYKIGIGTPLELIFCMPLKLYDPRIAGSVSPTEDEEEADCPPPNKEVTPSSIKDVPRLERTPPTPPV